MYDESGPGGKPGHQRGAYFRGLRDLENMPGHFVGAGGLHGKKIPLLDAEHIREAVEIMGVERVWALPLGSGVQIPEILEQLL